MGREPGPFEVILCALTGRLNLGPGVAGANKLKGDRGARCFAAGTHGPINDQQHA